MPASGLKEDEASPGYTAGRACRRFAYGAAREALIPLLLLSSLIISGCTSMLPHPPQPTVTPAPPQPTVTPGRPQPTVTLTTTSATTYYSVHGTTTSKIFEDIKAHGLNEQDGKHAEGLTSAKSEMALKTLETSSLYTSEGALCTPESVTITLDLLVTLPRHERPNDLSNDLRERWQQFVEGVAVHEQHHVDIAVNGANVLKTGIEAVLKNRASCAELETLLRRLWKSQQVEIDKAHGEFDAADRARVDKGRKPLQAEIDTMKTRLTGVTVDVRQLDATLDDLSRRAGAVRENINAVTARIAKANGTCSRPTDRIQALCRQYNALVDNHNALAAEYSSRVERRNRLASEHTGLVETMNELIETLNWVR